MPNELTPAQKPDMTRPEAQHALAQLRGTEERQKEILLEMYERNAHRAMGYKTWEEFAQGVFGLGIRRFYDLLEAARVERLLLQQVDKQVDEMCSKMHISSTSPSTSSLSKFNDGMLLELAKLKDPDKITRAAKEALDAASTMSYRGKESRFNGQLRMPLVKNIVNRMLSAPVAPLGKNSPDEEQSSVQDTSSKNSSPSSGNSASSSTKEKKEKKAEKPPAEKFARGCEHEYITCRWSEEDKTLRVIFLMADGTEGAVVVPGMFLP